MIRLAVITATIAAGLMVGSPATADDCTTVDYQGAPLEMCPPVEPDPTNCYTGDCQGAPIEVCLPTGEQLPEGSTFNGQPVVYHVSANYVAPVAPVAPIASVVVEAPTWLDELHATVAFLAHWLA